MSLSQSIFESLLLVTSLTMDAFAASLSYGAGRIHVPLRSVAVISLVCSGMLALALVAGRTLSAFIPSELTHWGCFLILFGIGVTRLCDNAIKGYIRRHNMLNMQFSLTGLHVLLTVYADAQAADQDGSHSLSPREATLLAAALSIDGLAAGLGSALSGGSILLPVALSVILTATAVKLGSVLGVRLNGKLPFDLSYASALMLILLAFLRF